VGLFCYGWDKAMLKDEVLVNGVQMSEMIHLSRPSIANIEHGRHKFQTHILYQISYALDCKIADLLPDSE
jgi:DNA-binding XRE family transcriptional regulator